MAAVRHATDLIRKTFKSQAALDALAWSGSTGMAQSFEAIAAGDSLV